MQKNVIAIIVVVLLLLGGGAFLLTGTNQDTATPGTDTTSPTEDSEEENREAVETTEVSYTNSGFSPETIRVEEGATVTWTNESDGPMQVASSVHPTHNELPEFEQRGGVGAGEEYQFQFDQTGEWDYHNHLEPSHKATVIVE